MDIEAKRCILIIDDQKSNLSVLGHTLRREYTVYTAKDGQTGLEIADEFLPDLILLDIVMPDMDGYEVLSKLKSSEKIRNIPVLLVTGLTNKENVEIGMTMGAAGYIFKPFNATEILDKVADLLAQKT